MSWIFEKSATWRRVVASTRASRTAMAGFTAACFVLPVALGTVVMNQTNPADEEARLRMLRQRSGLDGQMLAKANKERLGVLLAETRDKSTSEERYRLALDGQTKGTSSGTTRGVYRGHA